jgi:leucyl-tRNA synthetase
MKEKYFPQEIEQKWQKRWAEEKAFEVTEDPSRHKFYCLEMLAYTSGRAHIGHVSNFSIGDALSWYKRLKGFNVLHPFGWDAFGQPAETAAIKDGTDPEKFTRDAIAYMKWQFQRMGLSYDWSREVATCDPEYYKWNQWFFIRMFERGMVYRKLSPVNWCPKEDISLSNEQASGGECWRCGSKVIQKELMQWFARITDYAEQLLQGLGQLEGGWPERVITMQRNWIGRSQGAQVGFKIEGIDDSIVVFTTRIDTIFGANAIILAAEHPMLGPIVADKPRRDEVLAFAEQLKNQRRAAAGIEEPEKKGMFTGGYAINPFSDERIPIWIANFVLIEYGTGAIMAVPSGDQRDFEFSRKYNLPFRQIKVDQEGQEVEPDAMEVADESWSTTVNSGQWSGLSSEEANRLMTEYAGARGFGKASITYKLRDWGISRQRYWGTPVPMIHCGTCGIVPVPDDQLPVVLPKGVNLKVEGGSPLDHVPEFVDVDCPKCGGKARRDTDTMDTFVDSNWYYFRYCDPRNDRQPFDPKKIKYWFPVDQYIGGIEHAVLHLIYTRYWTKVMRDLGLVELDEPVSRLLTQGMINKETYYCPPSYRIDADALSGMASLSDSTRSALAELMDREFLGEDAFLGEIRDKLGSAEVAKVRLELLEAAKTDKPYHEWLFPEEVTEDKTCLKCGKPVISGRVEKMSKSKKNAVDPIEMINIHGADALRLFVLFAGPPEKDKEWSDTGFEGAARYLQRVWRIAYKWRDRIATGATQASASREDVVSQHARRLRRRTHQIVRSITENFEERLHLNTCISSLMELTNEIYVFDVEVEKRGTADSAEVAIASEAFEALIRMLAPFAPHVVEELWESIGHSGGLTSATWPEYIPELAREEELEIAVQVNGKLRGRIFASPEASEDDLKAAALADEKVRAAIEGLKIVKTIVIPKRLVNVVVK